MSLLRTLLPCAIALSTAASVPDVARAQTLTLTEAMRWADDNAQSHRIARARVESARAARRRAWASILPVLSVSGTYRRRAREVVRNVSGSDVVISRNDAFSAAARADIALFDATVFPRIAAAAHDEDAASHDANEATRALALDVAEAYYSILAAEQIAAAAGRRVEVAEEEADAAARRLEAGLEGRNALSRAQLELASARLEAVQADNGLTQSRLSLELLVGREIPEALAPADGPVAGALPYPELRREALSVRDDLRALRARRDAASARRDEPWLEHVPRVDASALFTWTNEAGFSEQNTDWTIAVTATWVAYDGGARYADLRSRDAELAELALTVEEAERTVGIEVRSALADLGAATAAVEAARARVEAADRNLEEVRARFERGLDDALAMADASEQSFLAAAALAGQDLELRLAEIALLRATGRTLRDR